MFQLPNRGLKSYKYVFDSSQYEDSEEEIINNRYKTKNPI